LPNLLRSLQRQGQNSEDSFVRTHLLPALSDGSAHFKHFNVPYVPHLLLTRCQAAD